VTVSRINGAPFPAISGATGVLYDNAGTLSVANISGAMIAPNSVTAAQLGPQYSRAAALKYGAVREHRTRYSWATTQSATTPATTTPA